MARLLTCAAARVTARLPLLLLVLLVLHPQMLCGERIHPHSLLETGEDEGLGEGTARGATEEGASDEAHTEEHAKVSAASSWSVFGENGAKMRDVKQGRLGDCYYLAVLASIARVHPDIIEGVFVKNTTVNVNESKFNIYQLRFFVDGVETLVAVDDVVPMACQMIWNVQMGDFHFACPRDGKTVWPLLLEKGFAKIFGSYLAIRSGTTHEAFKAITQAPVDQYLQVYRDGGDETVWEDTDGLWDSMEEALDQKFPMTAGSVENPFGTVNGHAFAVIGLKRHHKHGRVVRVYNPWAENRYNGSLSERNDQSKGDYWMTFEEFTEAFSQVEVARVRKGYSVRYKRVPVGKPVALKFTVRGSSPFTLQLEWPSQRFFKIYGCAFHLERVKLMVARVGYPGWEHAARERNGATSNLKLDLQGSGEYLVYAYGSFDGAPWATEMAVNVYSKEPIDFEELDDPLAVGRKILGFPCKDLKVPGFVSSTLTFGLITWWDDFYEALPYAINGSPAWVMQDDSSKRVIWADGDGMLVMAPSENHLDRYYPSFDPAKLQCTADLSASGATKEQTEPDTLERAGESCRFTVGEQVFYKREDTWICSEVDIIYGKGLKIRYLRTGEASLGCRSEKLKKGPPCKFHEDDRVRYKDDVAGWVDEQIAKVECGTVTLSSGKEVDCTADLLAYPDGCKYYVDENVLVWSRTLKRWSIAEVTEVNGEKVRVEYPTDEAGDWLHKEVPCSDERLVRKLTRCDRRSHEQIARFRELDNFDELADGYEDYLFPPSIESIGPKGADCGDSATGGPALPCGRFNSWGPISKLLQ